MDDHFDTSGVFEISKYIISNCGATLQKMLVYIPNVDLVDDKVYTKFSLNKSICSRDIEKIVF